MRGDELTLEEKGHNNFSKVLEWFYPWEMLLGQCKGTAVWPQVQNKTFPWVGGALCWHKQAATFPP